jgi:4-hydroxybenzoyl-CoA thioesterase
MFLFRYVICFDDVDAAGIVYYPRYFHFCHLALESLFNEKAPLRYADLIFNRRIGLPIVHVEADYKHPIIYGDEIAIEVINKIIKTSSWVTTYRFLKEDQVVFMADVTTVCIDLEKRQSMPLPSDLREFFHLI